MTPCEECLRHDECQSSIKDMANAKFLCIEHPKYGETLTLGTTILDPAIMRAYPSVTKLGFEDVLKIPDVSFLKYLDYKGNRYTLDILECSKIILEKYVAVDYIKYLKNEGKLSLKAYNDYIDLSISKPLTQEEFDLLKEALK